MKLFKLLETTYENFDETMKSYLMKAFASFNQAYSDSSIYNIILNGVKGVMQNIMFYIEDAIGEQNIFTAVRKKSVYSLAKISGYDAWYGSSAVGTISISNKITNGLDSGSTKLVIPNKTVITNANTGYDYMIWLDNDSIVIDMTKPLVSYEMKIVQGSTNTATYTAKGEKLETFEVSPSGLFDMSYVEVKVNNVKWTNVTNIYDMTEDGQEVVVTSGYDGGISIMFGDGIHGTRLEEGDSVTITYVTHKGSYGNVAYKDAVNLKFKSQLVDGLGNTVNGSTYLDIKLTNYISGGSDSDTVDTMKSMIGCNSRSLVLSSEDNFKLFLSRYGFISTANIIMHKNSLSVNICPIKKQDSDEDYISSTSTSLYLSDYQKYMILNSINESKKAFAGLNISIIDPIIRKYGIICYVKADSEYAKETIKTNINSTVCDYFRNLPMNTTFISKSDILSQITTNVDGFSSIDIDIISNDNETAKTNGYWYKYEVHKVNETYKTVPTRQIYDKENPVGLDYYGNIVLNSLLEVPVLYKGVKINVSDSSQSTKYSTITMQDFIEYHFI